MDGLLPVALEDVARYDALDFGCPVCLGYRWTDRNGDPVETAWWDVPGCRLCDACTGTGRVDFGKWAASRADAKYVLGLVRRTIHALESRPHKRVRIALACAAAVESIRVAAGDAKCACRKSREWSRLYTATLKALERLKRAKKARDAAATRAGGERTMVVRELTNDCLSRSRDFRRLRNELEEKYADA